MKKLNEILKLQEIGKPFLCKTAFDDYLQMSGINASLLKSVVVSPMYAKWQIDNPSGSTAAMNLGTAFHSYIELNDFSEISIMPAFKMTTKAGREEAQIYKDDHHGQIIITSKESDVLLHMIRNLEEREIYQNEIVDRNILKESSGWYKYILPDFSELEMKFRMDGLDCEKGIMWDWKTTGLPAADFNRSVWKFGYDLQAAFYLDGINAVLPNTHIHTFRFMVTETKPPFDTMFFEVSDEFLARGRDKYQKAIEQWSIALHTGSYAGYLDEIETLN